MKYFVGAIVLIAMFVAFGIALANADGPVDPRLNALAAINADGPDANIYALPDPGTYWTPEGRGGMPDIANVLVFDWPEMTTDGKPIQRTTFAYYLSGEKYRNSGTIGCVLLHDFYRNGDWLTTNGGSLGAATEVRCAPWMTLTESDLFSAAQFNAFIYEQMSMQCPYAGGVYAMDESAIWGIEEMEAKVDAGMEWGDLDSICNPTHLTAPMRYHKTVGSQQSDYYGFFVVGAMPTENGEPFPWDVLITWERNERGMWQYNNCDIEYLEEPGGMIVPSDTLSPHEYAAILYESLYVLCESAKDGFANGTGLALYDDWLWTLNGFNLADFEQEISELRPRAVVEETGIVFVPVITR